jgi:hypothetical protein
MTFRTYKNFCMEYMQFEVADFEMAYNVFLGRLALAKFMAIPHYTYLVLKMLGPNGIILIRGTSSEPTTAIGRDVRWPMHCWRS